MGGLLVSRKAVVCSTAVLHSAPVRKEELFAGAHNDLFAGGPDLDTLKQRAKGFLGDFLRHGVEEQVDPMDDGYEFGRTDDRVHLTIPAYLEKIPKAWKDKWLGEEIPTSSWKPKLGFSDEITPVMREFILSCIPRFDQLIPNEEFYLYVEQSRRWYTETKSIEITDLDPDDAVMFLKQELQRMADNSLYALDRYVSIRQDTSPDGFKYEAGCPQAYLCYWLDRGNNITLLKGRQAAITSTVMALLCIKLLMTNAWTGVLLTDDKVKTGEDLFDKKVQGTLKLLPEQFTLDWKWDRASKDNVTLDFRDDNKKDSRRKNYSDLLLISSDDSQAVNSKSPTITAYDEAQNIPQVAKISKEVNPTQFAVIEGELRRVRQQAMWGCVCAGTKVWTNDGRLINIEDLKKKDGIVGYDGIGASKETITYWQPPAEKECFRITTNTGRVLECSDDHPILWSRSNYRKHVRSGAKRYMKKLVSFVEARDIALGDQVAVITGVEIYGAKTMDNPRVVGWLIGDGYYGGKAVRLSNCDKEITSFVENNFDSRVEVGYQTKDGRAYKELRMNATQSWLRSIGIMGQSGQRKRLPLDIHSYTKNDICELLGGLFDADGNVDLSAKAIHLTGGVYPLMDEVRMLLQKVGIHCNITRIKANPATNQKDRNDWWDLSIARGQDVLAFSKTIQFFVKSKQNKLLKCVDWYNDRGNRKKGDPTEYPGGIWFERVVSVEAIGPRPVYNLTAGNTNTYVANGIVTHNTGTSNPVGKGIWLKDWRALYKATMAGEQTGGWIVLFFDWTCRPKATLEWYMSERAKALQKYKYEGDETALHIFASACPSSPDDAFMENHKMAIPAKIIKKHRDRLMNLDDSLRPIKGMFVPEYDFSRPTMKGGHADHEYYIKGARFVRAVTSLQMLKAPVEMMFPPVNDWLDRNFMGTDPIQSDTGRSKHSSAIWDSVGYHHDGNGPCPAERCGVEHPHFHPRLACVVNGRTGNVKDMYTQSILMNLAYHNYGKRGCQDLVEWNQGQKYIEYKQFDWIDQRSTLLPTAVLPTRFQSRSKGSGGSPYGIYMTPPNKGGLLPIIEDMVDVNGNGIMHLSYWHQLAEVELDESDGKKTWATRDEDQFNDDIVMSVTLAKLCADSVSEKGRKPRKFNSAEAPARRTRTIIDRRDTMFGTRLYERQETYDVRY